MKLTFRIQYHTNWGEHLRVVLNGDADHPIFLHTQDGENWIGSSEYPTPKSSLMLSYRYGVYAGDRCLREELGRMPHSFQLLKNANEQHYLVNDCWRDLPRDNYKYSSAFNVPHELKNMASKKGEEDSFLTFRALCPELANQHQTLGLVGSIAALGSWDAKGALRMHETATNVWQLDLKSKDLSFPFEYKFIALDAKTGEIKEWEDGDNRYMGPLAMQKSNESYLLNETEVAFASANQKVAGTAIPVFSLRSEGSCGVGDFGDLKTFIDWASMTHQRAVQILPINDTTITNTWQDSYPYNSISIYAFHPMYIDIRQLKALKDKKKASAFEAERVRLNSLPAVDYEGVNKVKRAYLTALFEQEGKKTLKSKDYLDFYQKNEHWLKPYGTFCYLRDQNGTPDFTQWKEHNVFKEAEVNALCKSGSKSFEKISFYFYLQYLLHVQLLAASNHARAKGVILKGDIPIGISRASVEAWVEPYYFNMNGQAGAPPDAFSTKGQNWGFPTYNWDVMEKDNYLWWRRRFSKMSDYFTAYRIDHILGFFRIWEIPTHSVHGLLGQFVPSLPMSEDEINGFGLYFQKDFMTKPFINEEMLQTLFGDRYEYVKKTFVKHEHDDIYQMRPEFDTQRKVEAFFADKTDEDSLNLKETLYSLISDVLFIADRKNPELYHPRICVQNDYIFQRLSGQEKEAFNRLYNHYYYQRHNQFWYGEAMKKLPILTQSTPMLVCGEDLGMVPESVPWVMKQLQILSLEIQRMPKDPSIEFGHVNMYPKDSVCSIGTHDMSTFRGWWEEDKELTEKFFHNELHQWGEVPEQAPGWLCKKIVEQHLYSPSLLCILTWQDWTSINEALRNPDVEGERINVPANPRHYWRWRMHITLEDLMKEDAFNEEIRSMVDCSGR